MKYQLQLQRCHYYYVRFMSVSFSSFRFRCRFFFIEIGIDISLFCCSNLAQFNFADCCESASGRLSAVCWLKRERERDAVRDSSVWQLNRMKKRKTKRLWCYWCFIRKPNRYVPAARRSIQLISNFTTKHNFFRFDAGESESERERDVGPHMGNGAWVMNISFIGFGLLKW